MQQVSVTVTEAFSDLQAVVPMGIPVSVLF